MKNKNLLQVRIRYFIYIFLCVVFYSLYISGLLMIWYENEMGLFMNSIFSSFLKKNLEPILVGFTLAIMTIYLVNTISNIILKIALIINE